MVVEASMLAALGLSLEFGEYMARDLPSWKTDKVSSVKVASKKKTWAVRQDVLFIQIRSPDLYLSCGARCTSEIHLPKRKANLGLRRR